MRRVFLVGSALLLAGCEAGPPAPAPESAARAVSGSGPITLAPVDTWRRLNPAGTFHTSPVPVPGGRWVALSGWRGRGLFAVPVAGGPLVTVQEGYLGPRRPAGGPDRLCLEDAATRQALVADLARGELAAARGAECVGPDYAQDSLGLVLHAAPGRTLWLHPRRGQLHEETPARGPRLLAEAPMWDVVPGPSGRHVAYATGTLAEPRLHVLDVASGRVTDLGPGAQPAWLPDGAALVYAVPAGVQRRPGTTSITAADLFGVDLADLRPRQLTRTPAIAEMQPAVSSDGRTLLLSDWRGGGIFAVAISRGVRP